MTAAGTIGRLVRNARDESPLYLASDRPLSMMRVDDPGVSIARALLEAKATTFTRRIPVLVGEEQLAVFSEALDAAGASVVVPVTDSAQEQFVMWLDMDQFTTLLREDEELRYLERAEAVAVGRVALQPVWLLGAEGERPPLDQIRPNRTFENMTYWNSRWRSIDPPADSDGWYRTWPTGGRDAARRISPLWYIGARRSDVRGAYTASISPENHEAMGRPRVVAVENPLAPGAFLPAIVRCDPKLSPGTPDTAGAEPLTVALDKSLRDPLGIHEGNFCRLYPWHGRHVGRSLQRAAVGARTVIAQAKIPLRADLDKPLCRLPVDALEALGARSGDAVIVEALQTSNPSDPSKGDWTLHRKVLRVLPIAEEEARERREWESPTGSHGHVDCGEKHGVQPPYPAIYLDYFVRKALGDVPTCSPVQVRASIARRLGDDLSEFFWVGIIALVATVLATTKVSVLLAVVVTAVVITALLWLRVRKALR